MGNHLLAAWVFKTSGFSRTAEADGRVERATTFSGTVILTFEAMRTIFCKITGFAGLMMFWDGRQPFLNTMFIRVGAAAQHQVFDSKSCCGSIASRLWSRLGIVGLHEAC